MLIAAAYKSNRLRALACLMVGVLATGLVHAQNDAAELEELVAPVALYPDDLLAIVLPASTYPLQVVQAARFLEDRKKDPDLEPDDEWDDAVVALLNYPEVIAQLNDDLDWTWALGEAFIDNRAATLDAVQQFRERAALAGNLKTDEHQVVQEVEGVIEIEPADPEVIYVPYYEPSRVVVRHYTPVYHYYPRAYPVYYYPYPYGYTFADHYFWGVTTYFAFNWVSHSLHSHHYNHYRHPYRGRHYYKPHYARHHYKRHYRGGYKYRYNDVWRPARRHGARPRHGGKYWTKARVNRDRRNFDNAPRGRRFADRNVRRDQRRNIANNRTRANRDVAVNRNQSRTSFAPRDGRRRNLETRGNPNRRNVAPGEARQQRAATRRRATGENTRTRMGQNRNGAQNRRNNVANTSRTPAPRQRAAAADRSAPARSAPRRSAPTRSVQPRSGAARAAQARSAPRRAAPARSVQPRSGAARAAQARSAPRRSAPARSAPARSAPARSAPNRSGRQARNSGSFDHGRRAARKSGRRLR